ncbi:MAG TPA: alcohol dehydrogenase catalytic domain-containing protein [Candidatus Bathyarchaeia archaeon]|nr:alcohol dehydrogenase catalytic domain-containing protein [Candidatus Bathyarchaeia archaeon]
MLAAVYYNNKDVRIVDMPKPEIGEDEFLLKVMASGICGSDVTEWYRVPKAPVILGHEATGTIEKTGSKVTKFKVGDRVFVSHHVPCNKCRYCLKGHHTACETLHNTNYYPGGFAQYIRVPRINVEQGTYKLPAKMSFEDGTFIEPLACVVRGQRLAGITKNSTLLIIGSGLSGLLHLKLAKLKGTQKKIACDVNPYRLEGANEFGADYVINAKENVPQKLKENNEGRLADHVVVCTGATQAALTALECVDKGGTILYFAVPDPTFKIPLPITQFWRSEITIKTSYGAAPTDLNESFSLLAQKKVAVSDMISHRLSIRQAAEGFRLTAEADKSLKVILEPNNE